MDGPTYSQERRRFAKFAAAHEGWFPGYMALP